MDKRQFQIPCFFIFIALSCSAETGVKQDDDKVRYDPTSLLAKAARDFQNSVLLRTVKPLQWGSVDTDFEFTPFNFELNIHLQNVSKCMQDILYMLQNIGSEWALKMIDSYGKPESGIINGNVKWIGDYNECVGIRVSNPNKTFGNFRGKYCSLTWSSESLNLSLPFTFVSSVCIPDSCSSSDLQADALIKLMQMAGILPAFNHSISTMNSVAVKCKTTERALNAAAIAVVVLLSLFCACAVLGSCITVVKYFKRIIEESKSNFESHKSNELNNEKENMLREENMQDDETLLQDATSVTMRASLLKKLETFFNCFCVFTNGAKLLNTSSSEGELLCIHGIRFLSMSWVILGHSYIFGYPQMKNMLEFLNEMNGFPFQVIIQAFYSVDSFFVLSGFLLACLSMKEFSKTKGTISWPYFYIHRYLRITPMYMIILGFFATVYLYLGSGPYWPDDDYDPTCQKNWWRNLLYINNFDLKAGRCMPWSWYLANDMQFFILSPVFLIALWRWPKIGYFMLAIFLLASCLCNFIITYYYKLSNGMVTFLNNGLTDLFDAEKKYEEYFTKVYVKPYTRIGPYFVGMLTGYIFFKRKASNAPKHSLVFLSIGWIVASSVTLATVYGLYHTHPGVIARSFYNAFSRICYAAGLSWVIYVCLIGQGGFINSLLSFKLFIPLSRLTYAAYLIHPMVVGGYLSNLKSPFEFSHPTIVTLFLGFMVVTYAVSLPTALILESPIVALEKLIRKKIMAKHETQAVN